MTVRRLKTYTADSGFVYQYYFVGKRDALPGATEVPATEYVFDVTADRAATYAISIFVCSEALDAWARTRERSLTEAEQYAAAKLRLLRGLDDLEDLASSERQFLLTAENIEEVVEVLGLE
jgi:hypothetical protein